MDAWLAPEAAHHLKALALTSGGRKMKGYLIGHIRGGRRIVESILPAGSSSAGLLSRLQDIETVFDGRILGFFLFNPADKDKKRFLAPACTERLVLEIRSGSRTRRPIRAFNVEFTGRFRLTAIPLAGPPADF
ncbi:MAG: hypothetical protein SCM96_05925 [Acidobacteriota bacterium]|nr:hypothetical protein [Acidobacteriota bacterium]